MRVFYRFYIAVAVAVDGTASTGTALCSVHDGDPDIHAVLSLLDIAR